MNICPLCQKELENTRICNNCRGKICRTRHKLQAIKLLGSKCHKCGAEKLHPASYQFHHPEDNKEYALSQKWGNMGWSNLKKEVVKCQLLCANCHSEIHSNRFDLDFMLHVSKRGMEEDVYIDWLSDEEQADIHSIIAAAIAAASIKKSLAKQITKKCKCCNEDFESYGYLKQVFCSPKCYYKFSRKVEWPTKEILEQEKNTMSIRKIGIKYGVSHKIVIKWFRNYGLI